MSLECFISEARTRQLRERELEKDMMALAKNLGVVENGCCNKGPGYASPLQAMSGPNETLIYVTCIYTGNISTYFPFNFLVFTLLLPFLLLAAFFLR